MKKPRKGSGWTQITTPYLDRHNDYLQTYVRADKDGGWTITDDGSAAEEMAMLGRLNAWDDPQVVDILDWWKVPIEHGALVKRVTYDDYYLGVHSMIQTMRALDCFVKAQLLGNSE